MKAGQKLKLKAKVTAAKGANKKLIWTSSNTKYATVSASGKVKTIYGMRHGVRGLVKSGAEGLVDLTFIDKATLETIARTPSAALGSTRDKPDEAYCEKILDGCRRTALRPCSGQKKPL